MILAARRKEKLEALAGELMSQHGISVATYAADLASGVGASKLYNQVMADAHEVGILVNNAGGLADGAFFDVDLVRHKQIVSLNITALMELSHMFGGDMRSRRHGRILNVCSTSAFQPVPGLASYAATKAFVLSLSEALAIENARYGITVTALCPGFVRTELIEKEAGGHMSIPLVKVLSASEVAEQAYLATMKGKPVYINGMGNRLLKTLMTQQPRWVSHRIGRVLEQRNKK